jgi:hypothetical protein
MPNRARYARIAITLPADDLAAADEVAQRQDRSRSWVIAEAIRRYTADARQADDSSSVNARAPTGLGDSRHAQLLADLRLTPEQRVRAAEETARVSFLTRPVAKRVLAFDRYEDYLGWKRRQASGLE